MHGAWRKVRVLAVLALEVEAGVFHGFAGFDEGGEVEDAGELCGFEGAGDGGGVGDVGFDEGGGGGEGGGFGVAEVVDDGDGVAFREEKAGDGAADVACSAGDEEVLLGGHCLSG